MSFASRTRRGHAAATRCGRLSSLASRCIPSTVPGNTRTRSCTTRSTAMAGTRPLPPCLGGKVLMVRRALEWRLSDSAQPADERPGGIATDPGVLHDIPAWCRVHGHSVERIWQEERDIYLLLIAGRKARTKTGHD